MRASHKERGPARGRMSCSCALYIDAFYFPRSWGFNKDDDEDEEEGEEEEEEEEKKKKKKNTPYVYSRRMTMDILYNIE